MKRLPWLYLARVEINEIYCPPGMVDVWQMHEPWRRGRALMFPVYPYWALVIGSWKKTIYDDMDEDFSDDLWINPRKLGKVSLDQLSQWDDLDENAVEEDEDSI